MPQRWTHLNKLFREEKEESKVFEDLGPDAPQSLCWESRSQPHGFWKWPKKADRSCFLTCIRRGCKQHLNCTALEFFQTLLGFAISSVKISNLVRYHGASHHTNFLVSMRRHLFQRRNWPPTVVFPLKFLPSALWNLCCFVNKLS